MAKYSMECPETNSNITSRLIRKLPVYSFSMYALQVPLLLDIDKSSTQGGLPAKTNIQSSLSTSDHDHTIISFKMSNR